MQVENRIEQAPACKAINLTDTEKKLYTGSDWKLAHFENGALVGFFDPEDVPYYESVKKQMDEVLQAATAWLANAKGETWLVMCGGYQLCDPREIKWGDISSMAHMARIFCEQAIGFHDE